MGTLRSLCAERGTRSRVGCATASRAVSCERISPTRCLRKSMYLWHGKRKTCGEPEEGVRDGRGSRRTECLMWCARRRRCVPSRDVIRIAFSHQVGDLGIAVVEEALHRGSARFEGGAVLQLRSNLLHALLNALGHLPSLRQPPAARGTRGVSGITGNAAASARCSIQTSA